MIYSLVFAVDIERANIKHNTKIHQILLRDVTIINAQQLKQTELILLCNPERDRSDYEPYRTVWLIYMGYENTKIL